MKKELSGSVKPIIQITKHVPFLFFLGLLFFIGLYIYKDYGFPWDEISQLELIHRTYNYINHWDTSLLTYQLKYLGVGTELILLAFSRLIPTISEVYARHLGVFLIFLAGLIPVYLIGLRLCKNSRWAFLAVVCLTLSPRIFGDAFYNSKDIPFMVTFTYAILFLVKTLDYSKSSMGSRVIIITLQSFFTALCISTRIAGVIAGILSFVLIIIYLILDIKRYKGYLLILSLFLVFTSCFTVVINPASWTNPFQFFIKSITLYSRLPNGLTMLYNGHFIQANYLPWDYLLVWIGITTPLLITVGFLFSQIMNCTLILRSLFPIKKIISLNLAETYESKTIWLILYLWLILPLSSFYFLRSTIYDGWRQMFFLYPAVVIFAVAGLQGLLIYIKMNIVRGNIIIILISVLMLTGLVEPLIFMIQFHPHQNVYFSPLAGDYATIRSRYEMDYWGLSYKQGLDYILATDPRDQIYAYTPNPSGEFYVRHMLGQEQKTRLIFVNDPSMADYLITEYRFHPQDYPYPNKVFTVNIRGMEILAVFKLMPNSDSRINTIQTNNALCCMVN